MKNKYVLHLSFISASLVKKEFNRFEQMIRGLYSIYAGYMLKSRLQKLRKRLINQRSELDRLISTIEVLLDEKRTTAIDGDGYVDCILSVYRSYFNEIGSNLAYMTCEIAETADANNIVVRPQDLEKYYYFQIQTTMRDSLRTLQGEPQYELLKNYGVIKYFIDEDKMMERIHQVYLVETCEATYRNAIKRNTMNLAPGVVYNQAFRALLSKYISDWREENGLTKKALSEDSGIERTTISNIESMRQSASIEKITRLLESTGAALMIIPLSKTDTN